jgi:hypothetical protein
MAFSFSDILREHIGGNFFKFKRGQVYAVKTQEFYQKTKIKLFNKDNNESKSRPIIILENQKDKIKAFAISTKPSALVYTKKQRKEIYLNNCNLNKEDCYKITFKNKAFVFILKNDYLKDDYRIYINTAALEELINEKQARYCGRCEEDLLKSVEETYG